MIQEPGAVPGRDPIAYFLTWTTYGTWLPGDVRGWVAKPGLFRGPNAELEAAAQSLMTEPALTLDLDQRRVVEKTISEHCAIRSWHLHAVNCRTEHVHVVVTAPHRDPEVVMDQFKAWCTRRLKDLDRRRYGSAATIRNNWWTQRGSKRKFYDEKGLFGAIDYAVNGQGEPTPPESSTQA
jgi:REP element-mobilizing transposase RayT